ncbi:hypothetical protein RLOatenuis_3880 [Rickettsiales bacterium]|nr:hypothetical protein RLOatenuis_3880 [Rickettsiales bacterium]
MTSKAITGCGSESVADYAKFIYTYEPGIIHVRQEYWYDSAVVSEGYSYKPWWLPSSVDLTGTLAGDNIATQGLFNVYDRDVLDYDSFLG